MGKGRILPPACQGPPHLPHTYQPPPPPPPALIHQPLMRGGGGSDTHAALPGPGTLHRRDLQKFPKNQLLAGAHAALSQSHRTAGGGGGEDPVGRRGPGPSPGTCGRPARPTRSPPPSGSPMGWLHGLFDGKSFQQWGFGLSSPPSIPPPARSCRLAEPSALRPRFCSPSRTGLLPPHRALPAELELVSSSSSWEEAHKHGIQRLITTREHVQNQLQTANRSFLRACSPFHIPGTLWQCLSPARLPPGTPGNKGTPGAAMPGSSTALPARRGGSVLSSLPGSRSELGITGAGSGAGPRAQSWR